MDKVYNWLLSLNVYNKKNTKVNFDSEQDQLESQLEKTLQLEKTPEYSFPINFSRACVL